MASTATQVIAKFRRTYPNCSATDAAELLTDVIKEMYSRLPIRNTSVNLNVTDGTQQYDLNAEFTKVHQVIYKPNANEENWVRLEATNTDKLDLTEPRWRADLAEGTPTHYYITSAVSSDSAKNQIGFLPIPDTTTSAGYPIVTIFGTVNAALTSSETMPDNLLNDNVIVFGMCYYWCLRIKNLPDIQLWENRYQNELTKTEVHLRGLNEAEDPQTIYTVASSLTRRA